MTLTQIFDLKKFELYPCTSYHYRIYRGIHFWNNSEKPLYFSGEVYMKIHIEENKKTPPKFPFEKGEVRWSFLLNK